MECYERKDDPESEMVMMVERWVIQVLERMVDKQMWKVFSKMSGMKEVLHEERLIRVHSTDM